MKTLKSKTNQFDGVIVDPGSFPKNVNVFETKLTHSLNLWAYEGK
jgi:hypothetical protein